MKYGKMRTFPLYFLALFILALFGFFVIGCDHVALLEYDDEDTYAEVDKGLLSTMAPPTPSDIGNALNILKTPAPHQNASEFIQAISTIISTMNLEVAQISDVNMSFSINDFVDSVYETLRLNGIVISRDTLRSIVIQTLNAAIREVIGYPGNRLDLNRSPFFALGERLVQNGITVITESMANDPLLDTGSFAILAVVINQAISASMNESIVEEIAKTQDNPILIDYRNRLLPSGVPLNVGSLPYYIKQLFGPNPEFNNEKLKIKDEIGKILKDNLMVDGKIDPERIKNPEVFNAILNEIKKMSLSVIDLVGKESEYLNLIVRLTVSLSHQGMFRFGWSS